MAKPKVFVSSTYYDLKNIRADIEHFIKEQGYEPVLFERGQIPYGKEEALEEYCHKEIENCDILVSIVGGKIGSSSNRGQYSISQVELKTALELSKQVYIFVERDVFNEHRTYVANKEIDVKWQSVDDKKIFEFLSEIYSLHNNNAVTSFETSQEILSILREQWSGLFQRLLLEKSNQASFAIVRELKQSLDVSRKLTEILAAERQRGDSVVQDILLTSHPIFGAIRQRMGIPYRVFFTSKAELDSWLEARGFKAEDVWEEVEDGYFEWTNLKWASGKQIASVRISKILFDEESNLKVIRLDQWNDEWLKYEVVTKAVVKSAFDDDDEVPF